MKKTDIARPDLERIEYAVMQSFPDTNWELAGILSGGLSGAGVYKIEINQQFYAVKLDKPDDENIDLARGYHALKIASAEALAPALYFADPERGVVLMKYIEPQPRPVPSEDAVASFAKQIRKLHDGHAFTAWKSVDEILQFFYDRMSVATKKLDVVQACMHELPRLAVRLHDAEDIRPSHCDLNPGNVIFDGKELIFVDWLSASPQNLYFDLAACAQFFYFFDEIMCASLLTNYLGREAVQDELDKYALMRIFTNIYYGIGFLSIAEQEDKALPSLSSNEIKALPSFAEFYSMIGSGKVNLAAPEARQKFGLVFLNNALLRTACLVVASPRRPFASQ